MKLQKKLEFGTTPLPLRWNGFGMIIAGVILMVFTVLITSSVDYPDDKIFTIVFGLMSLAFMVVGGIFVKSSKKVTPEQLAKHDKMTTVITHNGGSTTKMVTTAMPLYLWTGRIFTLFGGAMYIGGFYSLFLMEPRPPWGVPVYLFGLGTWILLIGLFFLWYQLKLQHAKDDMARKSQDPS